MRQKVGNLAKRLADAIGARPGVESIVLGEASAADPLDPYFALVLDVYVSGKPPSPEERQAVYGEVGALESSRFQNKDRFFIDAIPVRVHYKRLDELDELLARGPEMLWALKGAGTYMLYRVANGPVLFDRGDWMARLRARLAALPDEFWAMLREGFQGKMEHYLSDLGAASIAGDAFFYHVSLAGFLEYLAATLFMINRRFEPSHRRVDELVRALPRLPDEFGGRWASLLRTEGAMPPDRAYELAQLLARSVIAL